VRQFLSEVKNNWKTFATAALIISMAAVILALIVGEAWLLAQVAMAVLRK
jgi:hypothetical protein